MTIDIDAKRKRHKRDLDLVEKLKAGWWIESISNSNVLTDGERIIKVRKNLWNKLKPLCFCKPKGTWIWRGI
jgi:hypothetical protein